MGYTEPTDSSDEERMDFSITERDLLEEADNFHGDPSNRRTRRKFTKNDAIYGIWAEDEDEEEEGETGKYSKYSGNMSFVKAATRDSSSDEEEDVQRAGSSGMPSQEETHMDSTNDTDMDVDRPAFGGLGYKPAQSSDEEEPGVAGLGFKGKERMDSPPQGSSSPAFVQAGSGYSTPIDSPRGLEEMRSMQFGRPSTSTSTSTNRAPPPSKEDAENLKTYGFGFAMLQKLGYKTGEGLGVKKDGIVEPIETKLRPGRIGIAYKGFTEKTHQAKKQEKRHKSTEDDDETPTSGAERRAKGARGVKRESRPPRTKTKYKSVEEIMNKVDAAYSGATQKIIDMRGPEVRELASASELKPGSVEIKDDIRLIIDLSRGELDHLAREKRIEEHRLKSFQMERKRFQSIVDEDNKLIARLNEITAIAKECEKHVKAAMVDSSLSLEIFDDAFTRLENEYKAELNTYPIDSLCVAVCSPMLKRTFANWYPLEEPTYQLSFLRKWKNLFKASNPSDSNGYDSDSDMYITKDEMKPYESMLYHLWLPRVRSTVVNDWNPREFDAMVTLLENWTPPVLPQFIYDNVIDQLILPKLKREIEQWDPRKDTEMIHHWLHPWLPLLGDRLEALYTAIRHKFIIILREWHPSEAGAHALLKPWMYVFNDTDFRALLSKAILPKLKQTLRTEFVVNPRQQDLKPLQWVLSWKDLVAPEKLVHLLEKEFFPKWLHVLKAWLASNPNFDEVTQWYLFWKNLLVNELKEESLLMGQFRIALDLMNQGVPN
ncbi:TFP11-domain-containing protein [Basidiobolus meristosporus CBS 931.73]|uniref:TFP11-domain-containing protein n=1 Tax=Basidiobolus meristosporus CBS 931.73 TaxID=1314790 RepID=A0A1Y1YCZ3_9FUNG|nr:TFP11-domain-containing protein [Basidiobolus meristosporus CBS 931.73]|eukprot:ORX95891.1 TFP11-domain-containing protein [Basidiobolus meristosporus CBS 931.73]